MITNIYEDLSKINNSLETKAITKEEAEDKINTLIKTYIIESMGSINIDYKEGFIEEAEKDTYLEAYSALFEDMYTESDDEFIRDTMANFYTEAAEKKKIKISKAEYDAIIAKQNADKESGEAEKEARKAKRKERLKTAGKVALGVAAGAGLAYGGYKAAQNISEKNAKKRAAAEERARKAAIEAGVSANREYQAIKKEYEAERKKVIDSYDKKASKGTSYEQEKAAEAKEKAIASLDAKYEAKFTALFNKIKKANPDHAKLQDDLAKKGDEINHIKDLEAKDLAKTGNPIKKWVTKNKYKKYKQNAEW